VNLVTTRISATSLLQVWERGQLQPPVEKALTLLAAAYPDATREELAMLSIGRRDASLLSLREQLFGTQMSSLTNCPECGEQLELNFNVADIRATAPALGTPLSLCESGYELELRLPNSLDLLRLANCSTIGEMRSQLFAQCVTSVTHEAADLPAEIVDHAIARMGEADPQADVEVDLNCPECRHVWQTGFDIVTYLWSELHTWARDMLREVHLLASSYGWNEADILNMSAPRRRGYLEMLAG
jgi:hypothetical protein